MPRLSLETRGRVILLGNKGYSVSKIKQRLKEEGLSVSKVSLYKLIKKENLFGTVADLPRRTIQPKIGKEQLIFIDEAMAENDELTARLLRDMMIAKWPNLEISLSTIKRARKFIGWVATRPQYCQLVRETNKQKRLEWCLKQQENLDTFDNVIWTDECSVQLDSHGKLCFRKRNEPRKLKGRPKHPLKVHVWAGISKSGTTPLIIFKGTLTATRFCRILEEGLLSHLTQSMPASHRFQMDNDPKHTSKYTKKFLADKGINWWPTPPESPDLNPIENVWGSMKYYLRTVIKPKTQSELIEGMKRFWKTMNSSVCAKYIDHLQKVIPAVIKAKGAASGY